MKISIVIICDKLRLEKLTRLCDSMREEVEALSAEVLLLQESTQLLEKPTLPLPFTYYNIPKKQGFSFNRNQGVVKATGDIIVFIDDDCWVHKKWLTSLLTPLREDPTLLATTSGTFIPKSTFFGDCVSAMGFPGGGSLGFDKVWKVSPEGYTTHLTIGNCALRRNIFEEVGMFDESMKSGAEDAEFSVRMEKAGVHIKYVPHGYAFHEARTSLPSFVTWQLRRGRANYQFKQRVGDVGSFIKLRLWSAKNALHKHRYSLKLPVIFTLFGFSFMLQQAGYYQEKRKHEKK
jgi:O-antigen biosynthesis protein